MIFDRGYGSILTCKICSDLGMNSLTILNPKEANGFPFKVRDMVIDLEKDEKPQYAKKKGQSSIVEEEFQIPNYSGVGKTVDIAKSTGKFIDLYSSKRFAIIVCDQKDPVRFLYTISDPKKYEWVNDYMVLDLKQKIHLKIHQNCIAYYEINVSLDQFF